MKKILVLSFILLLAIAVMIPMASPVAAAGSGPLVTGGGNYKEGNTIKWTFAGTVGIADGGIVGQFQIVDHANNISYHCNNDFSSFWSPPGYNNVAIFMGTFIKNTDGSSVDISVVLVDSGEPGTGVDKIGIDIIGTGEDVMPPVIISGGNFQVHDTGY